MSDDPTRPDVTAASAALDGDASAVARADAGLVEAMRAVRAELADVTPPDHAVREAAIRAALAAYTITPEDATITGGHGAPAPVSLDAERAARHRQRRTYRIAGALAAAAVVAIIGVAAVVSRSDNSGSDARSSKAADQAATTNAALSAAAPPEASTAAGGATATTAASATTTASATAAGSPSAGATTTGPGLALNGPADVVPQIADGAGLRAYVTSGILAPTPASANDGYDSGGGAASTVAAGATTTAAPPPATSPRPASGAATGSVTCDLGGGEFLGRIIYAGHPALAVRISSTGRLRAIDAVSCVVLVEVAA